MFVSIKNLLNILKNFKSKILDKDSYASDVNGVVKSAKTIHGISNNILNETINNSHLHPNIDCIDKFSEIDGEILYDGKVLGGGYNEILEKMKTLETKIDKLIESSTITKK